jgi:hypothetical protein
VNESEFWTKTRSILHFMGICGAGKSTLSARLAARAARFGGKAVGTLDYDPHTPDHERQSERAFNRELDLLNIAAGGKDPAVHQRIVEHSLAMVDSWSASDANVILADRFHESYDNLPAEHVERVEAAIRESGFAMRHVLLVVADDVDGTEESTKRAIRERMAHTKETRPKAWWDSGPGSLDEWVREETECQRAYRRFCLRSPFETVEICTRDMRWDLHEQQIVDALLARA